MHHFTADQRRTATWIQRVGRDPTKFHFISVVGERMRVGGGDDTKRSLQLLQIDPPGTELLWGKGSVPLTDATLLEGKQTNSFVRSAPETPHELCFSVVSRSGVVDVQCETVQQHQFWVEGLRRLLGAGRQAEVRRRSMAWEQGKQSTAHDQRRASAPTITSPSNSMGKASKAKRWLGSIFSSRSDPHGNDALGRFARIDYDESDDEYARRLP